MIKLQFEFLIQILFWGEFQKGSPYLEDFDFLIDMKDQMGLEFSGEGVGNYIPNATKCMRWEQVKASHAADADLVIRIEQLFGMLLLLGLGIGAASVALIIEGLTNAIERRRFEKTTTNLNQAWKHGQIAPNLLVAKAVMTPVEVSVARRQRRLWHMPYE